MRWTRFNRNHKPVIEKQQAKDSGKMFRLGQATSSSAVNALSDISEH